MNKFFGSKYLVILPFIITFTISIGASAVELKITSPIDKQSILEAKAKIIGSAPGARMVMINSTKLIPDSDSSFTAIANLKPGKNLISISAIDKAGRIIKKNIRLLRIVSYDDIEDPVNQKRHWAKRQITTLSTLGIIEGYPDNTFMPDEPISRGELATWLARVKNLWVGQPAKDMFRDVPKEHWRAPYIKAVVDLGIMKGLPKNRFGIDEDVSRAEVISILAKAYSVTESSILKKGPFVDVSEGTEQERVVSSAQKEGLVVGVKENRLFEPKRPMKRAEVAMLFSRLQRIKDLSALLFDFNRGFTLSTNAKISTAPYIQKIMIYPSKQKPDGIKPVRLNAMVQDAQGNNDISMVWADLSAIRGPNNAKMNYTQGSMYSMDFIVTTEAKAGNRDIVVMALDKSGLKTEGIVKFMVLK